MNAQQAQVDQNLQEIAEILLAKVKEGMVNDAVVPPTIFLGTADGKIHTCFLDFGDDETKRTSCLQATQLAREIHAVTGFFVTDMWMKCGTCLPEETPRQAMERDARERAGVRISELPDKREAIVVVAMGPGVKSFTLSLEHWKEGSVVRFGEPILFDGVICDLFPPWWD